MDAEVVGGVGAVRVELQELLDPDLGVGDAAARRLLPGLDGDGLGPGGDDIGHHGPAVPDELSRRRLLFRRRAGIRRRRLFVGIFYFLFLGLEKAFLGLIFYNSGILQQE